MNDTTAYEAAFPVRAVSPSEEVEETAVCAACGRVEDARCKTGARVHDETFSVVNCPDVSHHAFLEPRPTPSSPSEPTATVRGNRTVEEGRKPVETAFPRVQGRCPMGCGETLFLGAGGHVTCSLIECPDPVAADTALSERRSAPTAVDERPSTVTSDGETAEVCAYVYEIGISCDAERDDRIHTVTSLAEGHEFVPREPVEAAPVEPLEGEWRRRDFASGTSAEGSAVWEGPEPRRQWVYVPIPVEQAIRAEAERRLNSLWAVRRDAEAENLRDWIEACNTAERERDEARGEVERLQAALDGDRAMKVAFWRWDDDRMVERGWKKHAMFAMHAAQDDEPYHGFADGWNAAVRALREARVSTPVREERGE